jgi:hypothetical protein
MQQNTGSQTEEQLGVIEKVDHPCLHNSFRMLILYRAIYRLSRPIGDTISVFAAKPCYYLLMQKEISTLMFTYRYSMLRVTDGREMSPLILEPVTCRTCI